MHCPRIRPWGAMNPSSTPHTEPSPPCGSQVQAQTVRATLPPSYALELLTIFAWEQGCKKDSFSLAQGLRTVLALVQHNKYLCVFWMENYNFEDPVVGEFLRRQLKRPRYSLRLSAALSWTLGE